MNISYINFDDFFSVEKHNTVAADLNGVKLKDHVFSHHQIIFFGSESKGISKKLSSYVNKKITIERYNDNVDSLNIASSVAIILSELKNQITEK